MQVRRRRHANVRNWGLVEDGGWPHGEPVAVSAMSTGKQGQLYLALRIAGHAALVAEYGPLPFVTDGHPRDVR